MSTPIIEQIAQAIETQLATITVENGYNYDLADVVRPPRKGIEPRHGLCVLEQGPKRPADEAAVGTDEWIQPFFITLWIRSSDRSEVPVDTEVNLFGSDVEKAVKADTQWTSMAIDSWVSEGTPLESEDGAFDGIMIEFDVNFRHAFGDPYSAP